VIAQILSGHADRNIRFGDVRGLLRALDFDERIRGSHHIYTRADVAEILNLQPRDGGMAKPYQVRQVREILVKYKFGDVRG